MATRRRRQRPATDGPRQASIYLRISLDKTGEGLGVERQEEACRKLCAERGWEIAQVFCDNDISATSGKRRPAFEALLASDPDLIVCWHTDRLVRLTRELERVIDLGVDVFGVTAGHLDLSNPAGRAVAKTVTAWAEYEGEQKAERQRAAGRQRALKGRSWWGSRPFGLNRDGSAHETEADALRHVYGELLKGSSVASLARWLNESGHRTAFGKTWGPASLRPVLLNGRNAGLRIYDEEIVGMGDWDPIVPEETWRAAVRLLKDPSRYNGGGGRTPTNLLTGIAECAECGGPVKVNVRYPVNDSPAYRVYNCKTKHCTSMRVSEVDDLVWWHVLRALPDPAFVQAWTRPIGDDEAAHDGAALRAEEATLRKRLNDAADDYADGLLTREQLARVTERTRNRLTEIEGAMADAGNAYDLSWVLGDMEYVAHTIDDMGVDEQRALISAVVGTVALKRRPRGTKTVRPQDVVVTLRTRQTAEEP